MKAEQYGIVGAREPYYCCPECGELYPAHSMYRKKKREICRDCVRKEMLSRAWKEFGKEYIAFEEITTNKSEDGNVGS